MATGMFRTPDGSVQVDYDGTPSLVQAKDAILKIKRPAFGLASFWRFAVR
jgi:hypothetical protein